jgi:hypothetical protein
LRAAGLDHRRGRAFRVIYSKAEAAQLGLRYPVYNEDVLPLVRHYLDNSQDTTYYSWQTSVRKPPSHGISLGAHYTGARRSPTRGDTGATSTGDASKAAVNQDYRQTLQYLNRDAFAVVPRSAVAGATLRPAT